MAGALGTVGAILGIAGGISNLLGSFQGQDQIGPELLNPEQVTALLAKVNNALAKAQSGYDVSINELQQLQGDFNRLQGEFKRVQTQQEQLRQPGQNEAYNSFLQRIPEYQRIAQEAAQQAASPYEDQRAIAQRRAQEAARLAQEVSAGQGNLYSGATAAAMGNAAGQQLGAYEQGLANIYGQTYGQQFGQLAGQGQQLARQDVQQEYANQINKLQGLMQNIGAQAGITQSQQQGTLGKAQLFSDQLGRNQAIQAELMGPQFYTPTFVDNRLTNLSSALSGMGAGFTAFGNYAKENPAVAGEGETLSNFQNFWNWL